MAASIVDFDTTSYNRHEVSSFIYEPVLDEKGKLKDFKVVYASDIFIRDWQNIYHNDKYLGALLKESTLMDDYSLSMMERFHIEKPYPFVSYMPMIDLHLFFEPMEDLPEPYSGFYITNITGYSDQNAKDHFLKNIRQMKNNAVLMKRHDDGHLETVFVSDEFASMMECSVGEAMDRMEGVGFYKSVHPEDRPLLRSMLIRHASANGKPNHTIQMLTAKKNIVWCSVYYAFIDDFGEHYIYCIYTDVTTLKEYEERMRSIYSNLGNTFYQDRERTLAVMRINLTKNRIEEAKGPDLFDSDSVAYSYTESINLRCRNFPIGSEQTLFLRLFDRDKLNAGYLENRTQVSQILYSIRRDKSACFVRVSVNITRHPLSGDTIAFFTEQECNSEKVNETLTSKILAQQFDMVAYLVNGRYGVTIGEASRIKNGNIFPTSRNGEYEQYLTGQVLPALLGTDEEKEEYISMLSLETIERELKTHEPYVVNIPLEIDKETYYKQFDFFAVDPEAKFYILLKTDTTDIQKEQMALNESLREALEAANEANLAKTAFLSNMSHEIRTPMNAIIGLESIALKDPDLPDRTREQLEKIGGSARHLLGLINDILDMSRIESGRMTLRNEEFSFGGMLEQINTMINSQCSERGLDYECKLNSRVDDYYIGDEMKLKQVIINILGNAVKFTPAPGNVTLTVEKTAEFENRTAMRFIMSDTGIGMDKSYLPKIFEAFSQENEGSSNKYGSTGLGMAITKNIVEMMNGNISVESEKGVGTTFTVNVTLRNSDRTGIEETDVNPAELKVLVIDDDKIACEHARIVLEEIGIFADTCGSGDEAVELIKLNHARRETYNLIFVDWKMPERDGIEVTRDIRSIIGEDSAVIILTGYSWDGIEEEAEKAGVDSFMAKPLFASNVIPAFSQAMSSKKKRAEEEKAEVDLSGRHILLAEDMAINAEIMMEILKMKNIEVEHAENGQIVLDIFSSHPEGYFDAILMDIRMPVMDGLEATKALRAMDRSDAKSVPIIALTANAFDEDVQRTLQAGMNAHLSKPIEMDRLFETLSSFIAKNP